MWQTEEQKPSTSTASARPINTKNASVTNLERAKSSTSLFKRAISFQFLAKNAEDIVDREKAAHIKMRYKDVSKHVIWPGCRLPDKRDLPVTPKPAPLTSEAGIMLLGAAHKQNPDPRTVLLVPDMEDHRSPYMPATINHVLRSDSEDSSDAELVLEMTRCSSTDSGSQRAASPTSVRSGF